MRLRLRSGFALLVAALLLAGCGTTSAFLKRPDQMESTWVRTTHAKLAQTRAAFGLAELIRYYVRHTEASVARLTIYGLPELAPSVTLVTTTPARFLSDSLPFVLLAIGNHPSHILLLDGLGHRVFEAASGAAAAWLP